MAKFSTSEAAKRLGVHRVTLQRAITAGRVPAPPLVEVAGWKVRLWSDRDIERARRALKREEERC